MICLKNIFPIITIALATVGLSACQKDQVMAPVKTPGGAADKKLAEMVAGSPRMTIFKAALERTRLNDTLLGGKGPYTVYAPSDDAFTAAGISLQTVASMQIDSLRSLVRYHIAPGYYPSYSTARYNDYKLLNVDSAVLYINKGLHYTTSLILTNDYPENYYVNGIQADSIDLDGINGVLYLMDGVLLPPVKTDVLTYLAGNTQYSLFNYALQVTNLATPLLGTAALKTIYFPTVFAPTDQAMMKTGFLRSKAAIDSTFASDKAKGTQNLVNAISFTIISFGKLQFGTSPPPLAPLFWNDLINSTYNSIVGFGAIGSSYQNTPYLNLVSIVVLVDAHQTVTLSFNVRNQFNDWGNLGTIARPANPTRVTNAIVYPIDAVILPQ